MNAINHAARSIFDVLLTPFELLGQQMSLILVSGLFGIVALLIFKRISWQAGIKATKGKIKGNMIAIRIYQDDLWIVAKSVVRVLLRNFQYLGLNFGPILPLFIPFMIVCAQFVVRYGFDPLPVVASEEGLLPGQGTMVEVEFHRDERAAIAGLSLDYPNGIVPISPLVRSTADGRAFQEIVATRPVDGEIELVVGGRSVGTKRIVAGDEPTRSMQPERVSSFWAAWLWPAEDTFPSNSPVERIAFVYPDRDLGFLPGGAFGIILVFFLSSVVFGIAILKPLNIQI